MKWPIKVLSGIKHPSLCIAFLPKILLSYRDYLYAYSFIPVPYPTVRSPVEHFTYQTDKEISRRQLTFVCWLQKMTSVTKTSDKRKYWWEGNYLQLKCDWGTQKTSKLVLPWDLCYKSPQHSEGDSKTCKDTFQAEELPQEFYQLSQIISVLSYANVIRCANGETLQILRGCNHAETASPTPWLRKWDYISSQRTLIWNADVWNHFSHHELVISELCTVRRERQGAGHAWPFSSISAICSPGFTTCLFTVARCYLPYMLHCIGPIHRDFSSTSN